MQMLLYTRPDDMNGVRLIKAVQEALPQQQLHLFHTVQSLKEMLCTLIEPESIAILSVESQMDLKLLLPLRPLLTEIFVVLILPDNRKGTIRLAHQLLPRFICSKDDSFSDLRDVLRKIASTPH